MTKDEWRNQKEIRNQKMEGGRIPELETADHAEYAERKKMLNHGWRG